MDFDLNGLSLGSPVDEHPQERPVRPYYSDCDACLLCGGDHRTGACLLKGRPGVVLWKVACAQCGGDGVHVRSWACLTQATACRACGGRGWVVVCEGPPVRNQLS